MNIDELKSTANEVRKGILTAVHSAKAGHPGGSLSAADIFTYLYFEEMNIDPKNPKLESRDRFVLSKGHTAPGLYSALANRGYFPVEDLPTLRHLGSYLQGHPDMKHIPGVDMSSGSLGQGISCAVGMALSGKLLNKDYRVYLVIMHLIWIICSLPIFTIGASTTALYYAFMKRTRRDEGYIWKNFFYSFKTNFRQATIIWLVLLAIGIVLITDIRIGMAATTSLGPVMIFASSLLFVPFSLILLYIFPVQAKFENTILANIKNALLMSIANLGYTLLMLVIIATFGLCFVKSKTFIGLFVVCGFGLVTWILSNFFIIIFRKYLPDEYEEDMEATGVSADKK